MDTSDHTTIPSKRCTKCGEEYLATKENFNWTVAKGVRQPCRKCSRLYHKIRTKEQPESKKGRRDRYKANHPDRVRSAKLKWQSENKETRREICNRSAKKNRQKRRINVIQYRTRKAGLECRFTHDDWDRCLSYWNYCCAVCGRPRGLWHTLAMDHWIPLTSPECPGTIPSNIVPLCQGADGCNQSKQDQDAYQWLINRFGERKAKSVIAHIKQYFSSLGNNK